MRCWVAVAFLAAVAAAVLLIVARDDEPPAEGPAWRLVQVNLCGNANSTPQGCRGGDHDPEAWIERVAGTIHRRRPAVVTVNEACRGQLDRLVASLAERGWVMEARFAATVRSPTLSCTGPDEYGNAVLVRGEVQGEPRVHPIATDRSPEHPYELRAMLCATVVPLARPAPLVACSVHVLPTGFDADEHRRQLGLVTAALGVERAEGLPLVVGGDFNTTYDALDLPGLLPPARSPSTYRGKAFDHLLVTDGLGAHRRLDAFTLPAGDHRGLVLELSAEDERR